MYYQQTLPNTKLFHIYVKLRGKKLMRYLMFPVFSNMIGSSVLDQLDGRQVRSTVVTVWIELIFTLEREGLPHLTPLQHWMLIQST